MGEGGLGGGVDVRLRIIAAVVIVLFSVLLIVFFRSCGAKDPNAGYTVIYSNLDLKDAANVITQIKALKIPYQIRDNGKSIAVPKEHADEARLGLAEKNLPAGGSVGWEIFDESKFGTTDFDRTIQFMRAISGELARTIKRIEVVEDARVQIVIPKTELFAVTQSPVTASVLIQLKPGRQLSKEQTNGIIRLVASSVENLRPENVTIVDIYGNILSGGRIEQMALERAATAEKTALEIAIQPTSEVIISSLVIKKPETFPGTQEISVVEVPVRKELTPEEKILTGIKAKEELETLLATKIQKLVNNFYPPNSILVKIAVEIADKPQPVQRKRWSRYSRSRKKLVVPQETGKMIKNTSVIVLIDNRFQMTPLLKKTTFDAISAAISYDAKRGDKITITQVPFHYASEYRAEKTTAPFVEKKRGLSLKENLFRSFRKLVLIAVSSAIALIVLIVIFIRFKKKRKEKAGIERPQPAHSTPLPKEPQAVEQMRNFVSNSPERIAELLKKWLTEEEGTL